MTDKQYVQEKAAGRWKFWRSRTGVLNHLDMELTERCNNNCVHCYINIPEHNTRAAHKELTTSAIQRVLQEAASLGCVSVRFTGGEPLVRRDFPEIYVYARRLGLRVIVFTNATLIDSRIVTLFRRFPPLERISISVYGMTRKSYESVTRKAGSYDAAWRGIGLLLKHRIPFYLKMPVLPANKNDMDLYEQWISSNLGMNVTPVYGLVFYGRGRRDDIRKNKLIERLQWPAEERMALLTRRRRAHIEEMKEFCAKYMRPPGDILFTCGCGCGGCVDAYGMYQPCLLFRHKKFVYDVIENPLQRAIVLANRKVQEQKAKNPAYLERCSRCFLHGLCEQCPAQSWIAHGTLDTPVEYLCEGAHAHARYLGLLKKNEYGWEVPGWKQRINDLMNKREDAYGAKSKP